MVNLKGDKNEWNYLQFLKYNSSSFQSWYFDFKYSLIILPYDFSLVLPVFANVILASRGIISVVLGALLCYFGYKSVDADIPLKMWIKRAIAAIIMITAIALYAFSSK